MTTILSPYKWVFIEINWNAIFSKTQNTFSIFSQFLTSTSNFEHSEKKWWASWLIYFQNYRLQKAWLVKCLKSSASEYLWRVNILKCPKHWWNLHGSSFVRFFYQSERIPVWKILSYQDLKSWDCLLTYRLSMTGILSR